METKQAIFAVNTEFGAFAAAPQRRASSVYERSFSFFSRNSAMSATPATLTIWARAAQTMDQSRARKGIKQAAPSEACSVPPRKIVEGAP